MTQKKRFLKNSFKKIHFIDDETLLRAKFARVLRKLADVKYVSLFNQKVVSATSNDEKHLSNSLFDLGKWDMEFGDSLCD